MRKLIISLVLIMSWIYCFCQTTLENKALSIISKLKEVRELENSAKKNKEKIFYFTDNQTKKYVEISVSVDKPKEDRTMKVFFYKYLSNGKLYKLDMALNEYKLVR